VSDDEWLPVGLAASAPLGMATTSKLPLPTHIKYENGEVMIDGDLQMNRIVTAKEFVKA